MSLQCGYDVKKNLSAQLFRVEWLLWLL